jgi:hypothetical protein
MLSERVTLPPLNGWLMLEGWTPKSSRPRPAVVLTQHGALGLVHLEVEEEGKFFFLNHGASSGRRSLVGG